MKKLSFITIIALFILTCSNPLAPELPNEISGIVIDENGNRIEAAKIEIVYQLDYDDIDRRILNKTNPSTTINFNIHKSGPVKLWITRYTSDEIIISLVDETLTAGSFRYQFDVSKLRSDVYIYHLETEGSLLSRPFLILNDNWSSFDAIDSLDYHGITNNAGNFTIDKSELAQSYDYSAIYTDEFGNRGSFTISDRITIWVIHNNYRAAFISNLNIYDLPELEFELKPR